MEHRTNARCADKRDATTRHKKVEFVTATERNINYARWRGVRIRSSRGGFAASMGLKKNEIWQCVEGGESLECMNNFQRKKTFAEGSYKGTSSASAI